MRLSMPLVAAALVLSLASARLAAAGDLSVKQPAPPGQPHEGVVVTPESSVPKPGDAGKRMHTNTKIFVPIHPSENAAPEGNSSSAPQR